MRSARAEPYALTVHQSALLFDYAHQSNRRRTTIARVHPSPLPMLRDRADSLAREKIGWLALDKLLARAVRQASARWHLRFARREHQRLIPHQKLEAIALHLLPFREDHPNA